MPLPHLLPDLHRAHRLRPAHRARHAPGAVSTRPGAGTAGRVGIGPQERVGTTAGGIVTGLRHVLRWLLLAVAIAAGTAVALTLIAAATDLALRLLPGPRRSWSTPWRKASASTPPTHRLRPTPSA